MSDNERKRADLPANNGRQRPSGRGGDGRFKPGHALSKGPRTSRRRRLDDALRASVTEEEVAAIGRTLLRRATEGDAKAAAILLDRLLGSPAKAQPTNEPVDLGALETAADCTRALSILARAAASGLVDPQAARVLSELVEAGLRGLEVSDLQAQVEVLRARLGE